MPQVRLVLTMAQTRSQFEGKLSEFLTGVCGEFLKARLWEALGWPNSRYIGKWDREIDRLLDEELRIFFQKQVTKSNFDRHKLFEKVLQETVANPFGWLLTMGPILQKIALKYKLPHRFRKTNYDYDPEGWLVEFAERARAAVKNS